MSIEPPIHIWGEIPSNMFNWTLWYRRDATIPIAGGGYVRKSDHEVKKTANNPMVNYWAEKSKAAPILVSNCKDQARRYKIIRELANL